MTKTGRVLFQTFLRLRALCRHLLWPSIIQSGICTCRVTVPFHVAHLAELFRLQWKINHLLCLRRIDLVLNIVIKLGFHSR